MKPLAIILPAFCLCLSALPWAPGRTQDSSARELQVPSAPAPSPPQEPAERQLAARIGEHETIPMDEYERYLVELFGQGPLRELVTQRLLRRESERLGVGLAPGELEAAVDERFAQFLELRFGGDRAAMEQELSGSGLSPDNYRASLAGSLVRELLQPRIAAATRVVRPEDVERAFEEQYGVGGVRVQVRHILLNRGNMRRLLVEAGADPETLTASEVDAAMAEKAAELMALLESGASFEALARRESHDRSVHQNGGLIPGYNYAHYGAAFAEAVRGAEVSRPTGPVAVEDRVHLLVVEERVRTDLEEVRAGLLESLGRAQPSWQELQALEERLWTETPVELFPDGF